MWYLGVLVPCVGDRAEVFARAWLQVGPQLVLGHGVHDVEGLEADVVEVVGVDAYLPVLHTKASYSVRAWKF